MAGSIEFLGFRSPGLMPEYLKGLRVTLRVNINEIENNSELIVPVDDDYTYTLYDLPWRTQEGGPARLDYMTTAMIFRMMACGVPEIKRKDLTETYIRSRVWADAFGPALQNDEDLSYEDFVRRIGLKVNVTSLTKHQFNKHLAESMRSEVSRQVNIEITEYNALQKFQRAVESVVEG